MKLWSTTPVRSSRRAVRATLIVMTALMAVLLPIQLLTSRSVKADQYAVIDAKISSLQSKVASFEKEAKALRKKTDSLKNVLQQLTNDRSKIQAEIALIQAEYDKVTREIKDTEKRIDENRQASGELIVQSSLGDDVPLIVRLASSLNLSDYIDGEVARTTVRDQIVQKTEENEQLKKDLEVKQQKVKLILDKQKAKRNELVAKETQQQQLVSETQGNEASYQDLIKKNKSQIDGLRKQQQELLDTNRQTSGSVISVTGTGGYPWAGYGYPCWSGSCLDPWSLYYLECTSYVAWRLDNQGYNVYSFGGRGHAYEWPSTTSGWSGARQGSTPHRGDAAVLPAYTGGAAWTGHVMYVEEVYSNGNIRISEYNWPTSSNGWQMGRYGEREFTPSEYSAMTFISLEKR